MSLASVGAARPALRRDAALAAGALAVALLVLVRPGLLPTLALAAVAAAVAVVAVRRPGWSLAALLVLLPVQNVVFGRLYAMGLPRSLTAALAQLVELLVVALVAAAVLVVVRHRHRFDVVDRLAIAYLLALAAYVVVPLVLDPVVGRVLPQSPAGPVPKLQAFRTDGAFVALFLAARHLPGSPAWAHRVERGLVVAGVVLGTAAILEFSRRAGWRSFVHDWAGVARYGHDVLGATEVLGRRTFVTGTGTVRVGSLLLQPLQFGFYQLLPLAIVLRRLARRLHPFDVVAAGVIGVSIALTFTRSAVLGAAFVVVATVVALPPGAVVRRARAVVVAVAAIVAGIYGVLTTVLIDRIRSAVEGTDPSAQGHLDALAETWQVLLSAPFGLGLATAPSVPDRFGARYVVSENALLQIGVEVGIVPMLVFVAFLVLLVRQLFAVGRRDRRDVLAAAAGAAGVGLLAGALFLHIWTNVPTSLTYFAVAGLALNPTLRRTG